MKRIILILFLVTGFWLLVSDFNICTYAQTETLEILTYYPAPYGVYKKLRIYSESSTSGDSGLYFYSDENHKIWVDRLGNHMYLREYGDIQFDTGSTAGTDVIINSSGNVGIGTTNPSSAKLQINAGSTQGIRIQTTGANLGIYSKSPSQHGITGSTESAIWNIAGIYGEAANGGSGVYGKTVAGYGVAGDSDNTYGIYGRGSMAGVFGTNKLGTSGMGVYGVSDSSYGVYGYSYSSYGIYGRSDFNYAGFFDGEVKIKGPQKVAFLTVQPTTWTGSDCYGEIRLGDANHYIRGAHSTGIKIYDANKITLESPGGVAMSSPKTFVIPHPLDLDNKLLIHACIEGPEVAVFYRGESKLDKGQAIVALPSYFEAFTREEGRTVLLTCKDTWSPLFTGTIENGSFTVKTTKEGNLSQAFYWEVKAVRKDCDPLVVEKDIVKSSE